MRLRNDRNPTGLDMGPDRRGVSIVSLPLAPMTVAGGWRAADNLSFRTRAILRGQGERVRVRVRRTDPCPVCGAAIGTTNPKAVYCGPRCRQTAWKETRRARRA